MQRWRTLDAWIFATLVLAALVLAGLSVMRWQSLTRLAPFNGTLSDPVKDPMAGMIGEVERCAQSSRRFEVSGWMARRGVVRGPHATRVLLRDDRDGRVWQLPTELPPRSDVNVRLKRGASGPVDYTTSGYAASLDLRRAKPRIASGLVMIAFDEGQAPAGTRYVIAPIHCRLDAR
jgi:hypothetical protein